jgi:hypothetical protein
MLFNDHEHTPDCGHSDETHRRLAKKMDDFMEDVAEDLFSEKDLANLYMIIKSKLRENGTAATLPHLKSFNEGFEFGLFASKENGNHSIQLIAGMKRIARLKQDDIKALVAKSLEEKDDNED